MLKSESKSETLKHLIRTWNSTSGLVCVAAVSFPFPGGDRTSARKSGQAKEHAWGEQKIGEKWGGGEREGAGKALVSPPPSALYFSHSFSVSFPSNEFFFLTSSQFRSHRVSFWKRLLRRLQRGELLFLHWAPFSSAKMLSPQIGQYNARLILANSFFSLILTVLAFQRN